MKTMKSVLPKAGMIFLIFTLLCGVIYTGVVTGIAQLIFPDNAGGSIIEVDGKKYGCELLGQQYTDESHMWGRIMNIDVYTYTDENGEEVTVTSLDEMAGRGWVYVTASLVGKGDGTFKMLRNYTIRLIAEGFVAHPDRYAAGCIYVDNIEFIYGYDNKDTANPIVTSVYDLSLIHI